MSPQGRLARTFAAALFLFLFAPGALGASGKLVVPIGLTPSGHVETQISINGAAPARAAIDTGANFAMVDAGDIAAAGLSAPGPGGEMVDVLGVSGLTPYPLVVLPELDVAGKRFAGLPAALRVDGRLPGPPNVLPATAFSGRVIDFDFKQGRFSAYDGPPEGRPPRNEEIPLREVSGLYFAKVRINRKTGWALIDTGSSITFVNSRFADLAARDRTRAAAALTGSTLGETKARLVDVREFRLGEHRLANFRLYVADPPIFDHLGFGDQPAMVLGLDALSQFRVQIDRDRKRLHLTLPRRPGVNRVRRDGARSVLQAR